MSKFWYLSTVLIGVAVVSGCLPTAAPQQPATEQEEVSIEESSAINQDTTSSASTSPSASVTAPAATSTVAGMGMVSYTNRAVGYTIMRPERWYWRHDILSDSDVFMADRKPLPEDSNSPVMILVRVSLNERARDLVTAGLTQSTATVAGVNGFKWVGTQEVFGEDKYIVAYEVVTDKRTYQLVYQGASANQPEQQVFEALVQSLSLQ